MRPFEGALVLVGASLLGCSSCPAPTSTASAPGKPVTLDAVTPQTSYDLRIQAPKQDCGCTWCDAPTLSLELSCQVAWLSPSEGSAHPVVRVALAPSFAPFPEDTLEPPLPLDLVLTPQAPSSAPVLRATHLCPSGDVCDVRYTLTVSRVESLPGGAIGVSWSAGVHFPSKPDGSLSLILSP